MRKKVFLIVILILCIGLVVLTGVFFQKSRVIILANYDDISYVQKSIEVTDDELQQRVKEKLSDYVTTQEQTVAEKGYLAVLDYTTYLNDIKVAEKKIKVLFWVVAFSELSLKTTLLVAMLTAICHLRLIIQAIMLILRLQEKSTNSMFI